MSIIDDYYAWLKSVTFLEELDNNVARISLPFLNRNNDYTEIYAVKKSETEYLLTDDGETCAELALSGFRFTDKQKKSLTSILKSFGVSIDENDAIYTTADISTLPQKKHMLVQCLIKVSDMFTFQNQHSKGLFLDDIAAFLDKNEIRYTANISVIGKSTFPYQIDFVIPKSPNAPERLIRGINNLDNTSAKLLIFGWEDTRDSRANESTLIAVINNIDRNVKSTAISSLHMYDISTIIWTERDKSVEELSA